MDLINNLKEIKIETPVDKIIIQIRELISSGQLKPGDRLPSERMMSDRFGVGRTHVRDAIQKLEFYGILKTLPQSGTVVSGLGITALEGLITDVLKLEGSDFHALVETRVILESNSAFLAAQRRTDADLFEMSKALKSFDNELKNGRAGIEEDLIFHLKIAEASKNAVLKSLMMIVTPDILYEFKKNEVCGGERSLKALEEHYNILECIRDKKPELAKEVMKEHLRDILNYSIEKSENSR